MARYINRGETLLIPFIDGRTILDSQRHPRIYKSMETLKASLHYIQSGMEVVEYAEVVHGRWIWTETGKEDYEQYWVCSVCGGKSYIEYSYCPNCGAKMDLE